MKHIKMAFVYVLTLILLVSIPGQHVAFASTTLSGVDSESIAALMKTVSEIANETPAHVQHTFAEGDANWSIDADVYLPKDIESFDVIITALGEEVDLDAVVASDVIPDSLKDAPEEVWEDEMRNVIDATLIDLKVRSYETEKGVLASVHSAPGFFSFSQATPREDDSDSNAEAFESGYVFSDGDARKCDLSSDKARETIAKFLQGLPLPFALEIGQVIAINPRDETIESAKGSYQIQIKQLLDGKPVAVYHGEDKMSWGGVIEEDYLPPFLSGYGIISSHGNQSFNIIWLSNAYEVVEPVNALLPLSAGIEIMEDFLESLNGEDTLLEGDFWFLNQDTEIKRISLEYVATGREESRVILTPCWSFEGISPPTVFSGFRVNALTGEMMTVHGRAFTVLN